MWMMLQQPEPDDYIIATGRTTSVLEFCQMAFAHVGLRAEEHITVDASFLRPAEVECLQGVLGERRRQNEHRTTRRRPVRAAGRHVVARGRVRFPAAA